MAKGGHVAGIRPKAPLRPNAQKIIEFRLQELLQFRHALVDSTQIEDLHNMRIAAKRLRYALEIFEICFQVKRVLQKLTTIQEAVGDIHDLDVLSDLIRERLTQVDRETELKAVEIYGAGGTKVEQGNQLRKLLYAQARDRRRLGLLGLLADNVNQRARMYAAFQKKWGGSALDDFSQQILKTIDLCEEPIMEAGDTDSSDVPAETPEEAGTEEQAPISTVS